jgi:hypothetical protein
MAAAELCKPLAAPHLAQRRWPPGRPPRPAAARHQAALRPGAAAGRSRRRPPAAGALPAGGVAAGDPELVFAPLRPDIDIKMGVAASTDKLDLTECELERLPGQVRRGRAARACGARCGALPLQLCRAPRCGCAERLHAVARCR